MNASHESWVMSHALSCHQWCIVTNASHEWCIVVPSSRMLVPSDESRHQKTTSSFLRWHLSLLILTHPSYWYCHDCPAARGGWRGGVRHLIQCDAMWGISSNAMPRCEASHPMQCLWGISSNAMRCDAFEPLQCSVAEQGSSCLHSSIDTCQPSRRHMAALRVCVSVVCTQRGRTSQASDTTTASLIYLLPGVFIKESILKICKWRL